MATTPTPSQEAAQVGLSLEMSNAQLEHLDWKLAATPAALLSPLENPPHD